MVVTVVDLWLLLRIPLAEIPPEGQRVFRDLFATVVVVVLVGTLLVWGLLTGLVHIAVRNHAERATLQRIFAVVGLAALVQIPAVLVGYVEAYYLFQSVSWAEPEQASTQLQAATPGESQLSQAVWGAVTLWQGDIWREGLLGASDVPTDRATLAAGVAVGLSFMFVVFG
jgi:hypothetical protein